MTTTLKHKDANVYVEKLQSGKNKICIELLDTDLYVPISICETSYPMDLIGEILALKAPAFLCDEILRDESPDYVRKLLKYDLLSYLDEEKFNNKRILDFGCGCGASTMNLARMFPNSEIVGVDIDERLLAIAKLRADHYGYMNSEFILSREPDQLPSNIGYFDYVILDAVYEHLLPSEREMLLPKIWSVLKPGGILFLNQTPYRYFPIERHTTSGLPFINYMPDRVAHLYAQHFSKRKLKNISWEKLLRKGIRGGSVKEVFKNLSSCSHKPILLNPSRFGLEDRIDLWYIKSNKTRLIGIRSLIRFLFKLIMIITGIIIVPDLSLAIKKTGK